MEEEKLIPKHGGYRNLKSFQMATLVYDLTVAFCERYLRGNHKLYEQVFGAARSGRQNIGEGSQASGTSKKIELKLVDAARFSLEELVLDFEDFLRHRSLRQWAKDSDEAKAVRALAYRTDKSYTTYSSYLDSPENAANMLLCLTHQAKYLLDRQLAKLEKEFLEKGGFTERLYQARKRRISPIRPIGPILLLVALLGSMLVAPLPARAGVVVKLPSSLGLSTGLVGNWSCIC